MLVHPTKNGWHIGIMFALFFMATINILNYFDCKNGGVLEEIQGEVLLKKINNKNMLIVKGENVDGICHFQSCQKNIKQFIKEFAIAKIDESDRLHEIVIHGNVVFGALQIADEASGYLQTALILYLFAFCYLYMYLNSGDGNVDKNQGKSA